MAAILFKLQCVNVSVSFFPFQGGKFECLKCGFMASRKDSLKRHIKAVHLQIRDYQCRICGKCFSQSQHLVRHHVVHMPYRTDNAVNTPYRTNDNAEHMPYRTW